MMSDDSILARANKLTSDLNQLLGLNQLEASMAVNNNGNDGFASPPKNGNGSNVDCDNEIYNMSDNNSVSNNAVLSMSDLMEIVNRQQSLIVELAAISMKNAASTAANISMATATTKQSEDTAAIKLQQHQRRGEDMTRSSDLHLLVSQLQQHHTIVDNIQSEEVNITNYGKTKKKTTTTNDAKSVMMKDYWRVLIVTIGCAIILGLAIGLGVCVYAHRRNTTSRLEEGTTGGGGGDGELWYCNLCAAICVCQSGAYLHRALSCVLSLPRYHPHSFL
jgi:hypothetical protein